MAPTVMPHTTWGNERAMSIGRRIASATLRPTRPRSWWKSRTPLSVKM